jgi:hypothetical protein
VLTLQEDCGRGRRHGAEIMTEREGLALTDEEVPVPYLSCRGCKWLRVQDFHYFYCRDLGDQTKPDVSTYEGGGQQRLWSYPHPNKECRFLQAETEKDTP